MINTTIYWLLKSLYLDLQGTLGRPETQEERTGSKAERERISSIKCLSLWTVWCNLHRNWCICCPSQGIKTSKGMDDNWYSSNNVFYRAWQRNKIWKEGQRVFLSKSGSGIQEPITRSKQLSTNKLVRNDKMLWQRPSTAVTCSRLWAPGELYYLSSTEHFTADSQELLFCHLESWVVCSQYVLESLVIKKYYSAVQM